MQAGSSAPAAGMSTVGRSFERLAAICAVAAGVGAFLYSIAFVADAASDSSVADLSSSLLLLITGLLTLVALIGVHEHVRRVDASFALLAVVLAAMANTGAIVHGGFDLANIVHEPPNPIELPNAVDPRGLMTFGVSALAIALFSWLMESSDSFPGGLSRLGYALAVLLMLLYLGRLIILDASDPIVATAALLTGLVASPAWFIWTGMSLRRTT